MLKRQTDKQTTIGELQTYQFIKIAVAVYRGPVKWACINLINYLILSCGLISRLVLTELSYKWVGCYYNWQYIIKIKIIGYDKQLLWLKWKVKGQCNWKVLLKLCNRRFAVLIISYTLYLLEPSLVIFKAH